ncbi:glycosyltransferase [Cyclobacterium xiamenense]|uniref:glycosyltransferase n=1 Tax=Cyclobacterium xiamenense TaxID=1297121 RepID=UPI0035CEC5CC
MENIEVTVGVVTYNSADFVEETLESVVNQHHPLIHLVVSDDGSTDGTLGVIDRWICLDRVRSRFLSINVLTVPGNTGVSANCNRVITASKTDWIKFIAGDDVLLPNCLVDNLAYVRDNSTARVVFSQVKVYRDTFGPTDFVRTTPENFPNNLFHPGYTARTQFEILLESDRIHFTPSYFFNKGIHQEVGGYDSENKLVEDYPMWLKLTQAGIRLYYFHLPTVGYRVHRQATNNTGEVLFKPSVINSFPVRAKYAHPHLPWTQVKQEGWAYRVSKHFIAQNWMDPNRRNRFLYRFGTVFINPFFWMNVFRKRLFHGR